ncbi:MAG: hypothetical protein NTW25_14575, partial [Candidatus Kapabacteria bacterium]|nr:hypothetical protein [Candidatus Kapabacteria bacterium]
MRNFEMGGRNQNKIQFLEKFSKKVFQNIFCRHSCESRNLNFSIRHPEFSSGYIGFDFQKHPIKNPTPTLTQR